MHLLCCALLLLGAIALQLPKAAPSLEGEVCSSFSGAWEAGETETQSGDDSNWLAFGWNAQLLPEAGSIFISEQVPAAVIQITRLSRLPRAPPV
jgi:hypothetical protein